MQALTKLIRKLRTYLSDVERSRQDLTDSHPPKHPGSGKT
jgi:hypothetical protein